MTIEGFCSCSAIHVRRGGADIEAFSRGAPLQRAGCGLEERAELPVRARLARGDAAGAEGEHRPVRDHLHRDGGEAAGPHVVREARGLPILPAGDHAVVAVHVGEAQARRLPTRGQRKQRARRESARSSDERATILHAA